jgi:hypothetical protein
MSHWIGIQWIGFSLLVADLVLASAWFFVHTGKTRKHNRAIARRRRAALRAVPNRKVHHNV